MSYDAYVFLIAHVRTTHPIRHTESTGEEYLRSATINVSAWPSNRNNVT